jgi:hypothetical protein
LEHEKANSSHVIGSENSFSLLAFSLFKRSFALKLPKICSIFIFSNTNQEFCLRFRSMERLPNKIISIKPVRVGLEAQHFRPKLKKD